jgi:hypothetical protein
MKISLAGNINIPMAVETLQKHIRQHLNATSGIDATKEIRISIENADSDIKESPYLVKPEELDLKETKSTNNKPDDAQKTSSKEKEGLQ